MTNTLREGKARAIVGLAFEQIRNFRGQGLLALLKEAEELSVCGHLMMPRLVKFEKILLRLDDRIVDVNDVFVRIISPEDP